MIQEPSVWGSCELVQPAGIHQWLAGCECWAVESPVGDRGGAEPRARVHGRDAAVEGRVAELGHMGMEVECGGARAGTDPAGGRSGALGITTRAAFGHQALPLASCHIEPLNPGVLKGVGGVWEASEVAVDTMGYRSVCVRSLSELQAMRSIDQQLGEVLTDERGYGLSRAIAGAGARCGIAATCSWEAGAAATSCSGWSHCGCPCACCWLAGSRDSPCFGRCSALFCVWGASCAAGSLFSLLSFLEHHRPSLPFGTSNARGTCANDV